MNDVSWLTYAFCLVWLVLGLYLGVLLNKQKKLEKRLQQIELLKK